jgi:ATP-dependent Lhr-like helicase
VSDSNPLGRFHPATRRWFEAAFPRPTRVQVEGWRPIAAGENALLLAPTGSGKTLAAFLWCVDRLGRRPPGSGGGVRVVYVSPLKALAYDVERNLRVPLDGIRRAAQELGETFALPEVAVRTGDTPAAERRRMLRRPAEILVTTPESLYLMLGSGARETLRLVDTVIVDEIHALAPTKRGAHLALSLERLAALTGRDPQRIGLSATQRPLDEIGRFLGGSGRPVTLVDASEPPAIDLTIEVPVDEMENPRADKVVERESDEVGAPTGIWAAIHPRLVELVRAHRSTIIFANSRRLCERLAQGINDIAGAQGGQQPLVRAHHGSVAREQREEIEELLKRGELRGIVATSSLELGIDMAAVDLVVQIESPGSVARGLQRVGRAGHQVGERSVGRIFPKHRGDLLEAAVVARGMLDGAIEPVRVPQSPLDVLAQQIVALVAETPEGMAVASVLALARRAYPFHALSRAVLESVLDMLSGHYPSDDFADLRPRLAWDRAADRLIPRRDARLVALVSGGTIPDRGLYAVHLGPGGPRIGELDEEMVYESRVGETFLLGASSWRILEITRDRVIVAPAPGEPGKMPFWHGDGPGRPIELGRALGAFVRELGARDVGAAVDWLGRDYRLDERAARNLWRFVSDQRAATGTLPSDREITVERFRDDLGDVRVCILSPFGARVHAPWAMALEARLGGQAQMMWSDDGIVLRFAEDAWGRPGSAGLSPLRGERDPLRVPSTNDEPPPAAALFPDPDEVENLVVAQLAQSALYATHFRENAARALLLPRRRPDARSPLWAQRLKAQALMAAALRHPRFPLVLETYRDCLQDVFDLPALVELLAAIRRREVAVVDVDTPVASPFARSLAFAYVAAFMYEGDAPAAERRAQALTVDRALLAELLGRDELGGLFDAATLDEVEGELQGTAPERRARHADALHDLLRRAGDLTEAELADRAQQDPRPWLAALAAQQRAERIQVAGEARWIAADDAGRYRDGALDSLIARWARTHGPFDTAAVAARFGVTAVEVEPILRALADAGRLVEGQFRPGAGREWADMEVMRSIRRRTLARLRAEVAPVDAPALARFLPRWHAVGSARGGAARLREAVEQLEGVYLPFADLEASVLPARVRDFSGALLDELGALGELVWIGGGPLGGEEGRVALVRRERARLLVEPRTPPADMPALHRALLDALESQGASFFAQLGAAAPVATSAEVLAALWDLVWAGLVTNDTFQPLRALGRGGAGGARGLVARAAGRWSSVASLLRQPASETERAHARAMALLERYGVVSREAAAAEGLPGGFAALAPVLRALEEAGKIRRGHFVDGLTGAQFAHPGAVERLRAARAADAAAADHAADVVALAATDPANPYGALLPWPTAARAEADGGQDEAVAAARRTAGARVVLLDGVPAIYVERGGRRLRVFTDDERALGAAVAALRASASGRRRPLRVDHVNGTPALRSALAPGLRRAGFRLEPGALVLDPGP